MQSEILIQDRNCNTVTRVSHTKRSSDCAVKNLSCCNLCLMEKLCILSADKSTLHNKRSELITKCRHENKFFAANLKWDHFTHPPWVSLNFIPTAVYGTVWWSLRAWNSSNCVTVSILNQYFRLHVCMYVCMSLLFYDYNIVFSVLLI